MVAADRQLRLDRANAAGPGAAALTERLDA
jgi:hypothetical protein